MINWVESVISSIPDHSKDVSSILEKIMKTSNLTEVDAHACALAAALASSNGELAFAIEMFGPLAKAKNEINLAKTAASFSNMINLYFNFVDNSHILCLAAEPSNIDPPAISENDACKFAMYSLSASIVNYTDRANKHLRKLQECQLTMESIQDIAKIAAVINTIGKIAPDVNQLVSSKG